MSVITVAEVDSSTAVIAGGSFTARYRDVVAAVKAVGLVAGGVRAAVPGVLLEVTGQDVALTAWSHDASLSVRVPVSASVEGRFVVAHADLAKMLTAAVKGAVKSEVDRCEVTVAATPTGAQLEVAGYSVPVAADANATDFPAIPATTVGTHVVGRDDFAAMFVRVVKAAGTDDLLPIFCHVRAVMGADTLTLTATDRYRIAAGAMPVVGTCEETVLLPAAFVTKLLPLLHENQLTFGVDHVEGATWTTITCGPLTARTRNHDGDYPRIDHLLTAGGVGAVHVPTDQLRKATARAAALTIALGDRGTAMRILVDPVAGTLTVVPVTNKGVGTAPAIPADVDTIDTWLGAINPKYLTEALTQLHGETTTLHLGQPNKPLMLTSDDTYRHVIMLMRLPQ